MEILFTLVAIAAGIGLGVFLASRIRKTAAIKAAAKTAKTATTTPAATTTTTPAA